jgi:hypothetical protein
MLGSTGAGVRKLLPDVVSGREYIKQVKAERRERQTFQLGECGWWFQHSTVNCRASRHVLQGLRTNPNIRTNQSYMTWNIFERQQKQIKTMLKKKSWRQSGNKLYRKLDRSLSAKLVPTFEDRGVSRSQRGDPHGRNLGFLDRRRYFFFQIAPQLYSRG